MKSLVDEVHEWNTPIIGAFLLWHFSLGYKRNHPTGESPVVLLHFIAAGILSSNVFLDKISKHRPNLESFVRCFTESNESDLLACLHQRIISKRAYTSAAIDIAVSSGLLVWDYDKAELYPREISTNKRGKTQVGKDTKKMADKAETLGKWFSKHDIISITSYLGVVL
jgi:hypothetical protein